MEKQGNKRAAMIVKEVKKAVYGKDDIIVKLLIAILAKGHILIDDIPGVGKTTMALAFSKAMDLRYRRLQFTPDVMPSDVTGFTMYNRQTETFEYKAGAAMCNLFLADEINRTSTKTQSALLEVMEEGKMTVDGITRETPKPFIVIATQNPIGSVGTQMLPESQMDRFAVSLSMGYPDAENEIEIAKSRRTANPLEHVNQVVSAEDIITMQNEVEQVFIHDDIYGYIVKVIAATRRHPAILLGLSPRATIALTRTCQARAYLSGRDFVIPDDLLDVLVCTTAHRLVLSSKGDSETAGKLMREIAASLSMPKLYEEEKK